VLFVVLAVVGLLLALAGSRSGGSGPLENEVFAAVSPAVESASQAATGVADFGLGLFAGRALRERVRRLEAELAERQHERTVTSELRAENARLRELLGLRQVQALELKAARIIGGGGAALRSLTLGVGSEDGVTLDAAVFTGDGLVGRVVKVSRSTSLVQLLADASSGVGVLVQRTRRRAVVVGTGSDSCQLEYVPNLEDLRPGDVLLTSGSDGIYPPGLPVGVVTAVSEGPGYFKRAEVQPSADPARIGEVLVVVEAPGR
jgi:rod shape-determining protein MreC